jgi:hypothetical protein
MAKGFKSDRQFLERHYVRSRSAFYRLVTILGPSMMARFCINLDIVDQVLMCEV